MQSSFKDRQQEKQLFAFRAWLAGIGALILLIVVVARLIYLQVDQHQYFSTLSQGNRVRIQAVPPTRGLIFDRHGKILAENLPSWRLMLVPEQVKDLSSTLEALAEIIELSEGDLKRFERQRRRQRSYEPVILKSRLNDDDVAKLAVRQQEFPGLEIEAHLTRFYPYEYSTAHVIGYVGRLDERDLQRVSEREYRGTTHFGKSGIERHYESILHGKVGHRQIETNAAGRTLRVLESSAPVPGQDLHLSLDIELQQVAEKALDGRNGAIVAIDPRNGEVLALASQPAFDPNLFVDGIDTINYRWLSRNRERPLFNRAIKGQYPPGSTIKPFVGLAGLEYNLVGGTNSQWCQGYYQLPEQEHKYRDWKRTGHGWTDLDTAIVESCDVYFYDLARNMGIDRMHEYMSLFGFGKYTDIDLSGERRGIMPSREWKYVNRNERWYLGETLITGIGQGFMLSTPLQLAHATATFANRGLERQPHLLMHSIDPITKQPNVFVPDTEQVVTAAEPHWAYVLNAMKRVVHSPKGTARRIGYDIDYTISGKTGTAQVYGLAQDDDDEPMTAAEIAEHLRDHALFVAYAPAKNPVIALAVVVEHGGGGGSVAAPVAKQVIDFHIKRAKKAELPDA